MSQFSDTWESTLLGHIFRGNTSPAVSTYHISLATSDFTDAYDTAAEVSTGNWSGYSRIALSATTSAVTSPSTSGAGGGHRVSNSTAIDFGTVNLTTNSTSVTVSHMGIHTEDSSTKSADQLVMHSTLDTAKTLVDGDSAQFDSSALTPILD